MYLRGINLGCGGSPILLRDWINVDAVQQRYKRPGLVPVPDQIIADVCELPFEANTFDVAVSSHVLEHLGFPLMALREWQRVLRPGGHLLLVVPDGDQKDQWLGVHLATVEKAPSEAKRFEQHRVDFTRESLLALFSECGGWSSVEPFDPILYWEVPGKDWSWQLCYRAVKA